MHIKRALFAVAASLTMMGQTGMASASSVSGYVRDIVQINNRVYIFVVFGTGISDNCGTNRNTLTFSTDRPLPRESR